MSLQRTRLTEVAYVASSLASVYANPASTKSFVRGILLHNTNTTTENVQINWVPDSGGALGSASSANRVFNVGLATNETLMIDIPFSLVLLDHNEAIFAQTTTGSKVTIVVIGDTDA